jgi:hypothetical protein
MGKPFPARSVLTFSPFFRWSTRQESYLPKTDEGFFPISSTLPQNGWVVPGVFHHQDSSPGKSRLPNQPQAGIGLAGGRRMPVAVGRTQSFRFVEPTAAPVNPAFTAGRSLRIELAFGRIGPSPVLAPFPDIASHVKQSPGIGPFLANGMTAALGPGVEPGMLQERPLP